MLEIGQALAIARCDRCTTVTPPSGYPIATTKWGGIADDCFRGSGFFRVDERDGVFWLVDPDGGRFLSKGVNTVRFDQDHVGNTIVCPMPTRAGKNTAASTSGARQRPIVWRAGNSTPLGCWSDELVANAGSSPLATAPGAELGASFRLHRRDETFPDVFDPAFPDHIRASAKDHCTKRRNDAGLLGTFIDNELYWSPDWRGGESF